jgi:hypothetical protein
MRQAHPIGDRTAPVVSEDVDLLQLQRVHEGDDIRHQLLARVPVRRGVGPAGSAQVGADHPMVLGEGRDDFPPRPPVLREAVQQKERWAVAGLGHVHPQPGQVEVPMPDPGQFRERRCSAAALVVLLTGFALGLSCTHVAKILRP